MTSGGKVTIDIRQALDEVGELERDKAQMELKKSQLEEKQDEIAVKLAELGVAPADIDTEIDGLERSINRDLAVARGEVKTIKKPELPPGYVDERQETPPMAKARQDVLDAAEPDEESTIVGSGMDELTGMMENL